MALVLENPALDLMGDALNTYLDDGVLEILDDAQVVVTFTLPDQAANTSVNGLITFGAIAAADATADGPAVNICKFWTNAKGALVATGTVSLTGAGGDIELDNTNILTGQTVTISSGTLTIPSGA